VIDTRMEAIEITDDLIRKENQEKAIQAIQSLCQKVREEAFADGQKAIIENLSPPMYSELGTTGMVQDRMGNLYERKR